LVPSAVFESRNSHDIGIVSIGSCDGAVREALDLLERRGVHADYMRVRAFPFGQEVEEFLARHSRIFVVEQNRDAQVRSLLTLETAVDKAKLRSVLHYSGWPMASTVIVDGILAEVGAPGKLQAVSRSLFPAQAPSPLPSNELHRQTQSHASQLAEERARPDSPGV